MVHLRSQYSGVSLSKAKIAIDKTMFVHQSM